MGIHSLLMSTRPFLAATRPSLTAIVALAAVVAAPVTSSRLVAQSPSDTIAVLAEVGRHFRSTATWPGVILADSPPRIARQSAVLALPDTIGDLLPTVDGYSVPSVSPRLARMLMHGTGPVRLLSRAPDTPCDSAAMDANAGIHRPWIGSSIRVTEIHFDRASAQVIAEVDDGTAPCRSGRDIGWWRYDLERQDDGWSLLESSRIGAPPA